MTTLVLVAALDRAGAIGRGNALPWHLPDDLKRFKALTLGHPVLMGRKTAEAIGRPLPGRANLVLTRSAVAPFAGQRVVASIEAACAAAGPQATLMVIGGGEVYALTLPLAQRLELTEVDVRIDGADTWFPAFDRTRWREVLREPHAADAKHAQGFAFVTLERIAGG
jgi:dihydrofolate reductase